MKRLWRSLGWALAVMVLVSSANASTISFTTSISGEGGAGDWGFSQLTAGSGIYTKTWYQPIFLGYGDPIDNPSYPLNLTQFNPSLGTLNKVTLSLNREVDASVFYQATSYNSRSSIQYYLAEQARWTMSGNTLGDFSFTFTNYPVATAITDTNFHSVDKNQTAYSPSYQFTGGFAPFIGTGTFATEFDEASVMGPVVSSSKMSGTTFSFTAAATVTYDYIHAPLPGAVWLLGSGLMGLGLLRRRKLNQQ